MYHLKDGKIFHRYTNNKNGGVYGRTEIIFIK